MMKPEPSELTRRGARSASPWPPWPPVLEEFFENSSIGEPGGRSGRLPMRVSTFCEVEMLTTASITCSATSAMFSGPRAAAIQAGRTMIAAETRRWPRRGARAGRSDKAWASLLLRIKWWKGARLVGTQGRNQRRRITGYYELDSGRKATCGPVSGAPARR